MRNLANAGGPRSSAHTSPGERRPPRRGCALLRPAWRKRQVSFHLALRNGPPGPRRASAQQGEVPSAPLCGPAATMEAFPLLLSSPVPDFHGRQWERGARLGIPGPTRALSGRESASFTKRRSGERAVSAFASFCGRHVCSSGRVGPCGGRRPFCVRASATANGTC